MLAQGKISSEEAEKLLDAVEPDSPAGFSGAESSGVMPKNLYVRVLPKEGAEDTDQVKVTIPIALVKAGINFMNLLPKDARKDIENAMEKKGIDLKNLNPDEMDSLLAAIQEFEVDVETSDNTVRIYAG